MKSITDLCPAVPFLSVRRASRWPGISCLLAALGLLLGMAAPAADAPALPPRTFLHPDRVRFDRHCLTIDGQDVFLYSGAFHFFRCPKAMWPERFQKIKDAGFNCVETYVAWNWCEREKPAGLDDFSKVDLTDLDDFLTMAESYGLYVLVRPGPYICAEWDTGGYPQWLMPLKPAKPLRDKEWLRTDDPVYLAWCKHWYQAVCPVIARHQITRKAPGQPGVILVQLENEYNYAGLPADVMLNQVRFLGETARAAGIDVPFFTCWTHPVRGSSDPLIRQAFDACNFYPRWGVDGVQKDIDQLRAEQPDAPLATTELQGGWFAQVGGKLSEDQEGVTASQINNLTLFVIQNGETMLNYYMLYGGTNPDDWTARDLPTEYDYNAPIRECGGVGDRYQRVWAIAHMLREHGTRLARAEAVPLTATGLPKDVTVVERRALDGSRYLFVRTSQHVEPRSGTVQVQETGGAALTFDYQLEPFGSKILYLAPGVTDPAQGEWLPKPAPAVDRPANLPAAVPISTALVRTDAGPSPTSWQTVEPGSSLAENGIYDSHFIFYQASVTCPAATNLLVDYPPGDTVLATVNGQPTRSTRATSSSALFPLAAGTSHVLLLYENHGHPNGGTDMETAWGIRGAHLAGRLLGNGQPLTGWRMHLVPGLNKRPEVRPNFDDSAWAKTSVDEMEANQLEPGQSAVFRADLDVGKINRSAGNWYLSFNRIDDSGTVYLNGKKIGSGSDWSRAYVFDVTRSLQPGHNLIAVVVKNEDGAGGLGPVALVRESESNPVPLTQLSRPQGYVQTWWQPDLPETDWQPVTLGTATTDTTAGAQLTWYRMNFELPTPDASVWVPWHLHLQASGNGFLYLNGQPLGRYWQVGPQRDYFLPACWLHFGPGQVNHLTLNLRSTEKGALVQSAAVEPYVQFAEKR